MGRQAQRIINHTKISTIMEISISDQTGKLYRYPDFPSQFAHSRHVDVWLPPAYEQQPEAQFPVLYMHDGQNLFDPNLCGYGIDWGIDEAITRLADRQVIRPAIVVGAWCTDLRWPEYMPQKALEQPGAAELRRAFIEFYSSPPVSDGYLRFVVEDLKPRIDAELRTLPGREDTFVMGSSMGGLVSLYAVEQYPRIFGGAGCLSTHWPAGGDLLVDYLGGSLPPAGQHKLYFDYGTEGLDADYEPFQMHFDEFLRKAGYQYGIDWMTEKFAGAPHNETAWRARVEIPVRFLLGVSTPT